MVSEVRAFEAVDYVLFALMLGVSAGIGIYYAVWGNKLKTTGEFLMGGRGLSVLPVAISILLSFVSAILILGTPAEMYNEGTEFYMSTLGMSAAVGISAVLYVPLLYPLKLTSSFEYFEKRFNSKAAKLTGTCIMILQQIIYIGIASFAPSTALEAVTGFPTWATIVIIGVVSTFYTSLGGMKAVVWTDVFQGAIMLAGLLTIVIQGTIAVGGVSEVWRISDEWGRIKFFDFNPDPTVRHTFWSLVVGGCISSTATFGLNQASVQRYCALPTLRKAKISVMLNVVGMFTLLTLVCLAGITLFAYYAKKGCDPLSAGYVTNSNQLIPYFVMDELGFPGVPGLFVSSLFSGALSSTSSSLNALSAVTWEDFLKSHLQDRLTEGQKTLVTKILVVVYGCAGVGMAFIAMNLGGTVLQASLSFNGAAAGPLLGMFALGAFFPWSNWIGAVVGGISGLAFAMWISIGAYSVVGTPSGLEYPTDNCTSLNITDIINATTITPDIVPVEYTGISALYTISYRWFPAVGASTAVVVGLIVSCITGRTRVGEVDPKYLSPFFDRIFCCLLPRPLSRCLRCYLEYEDPEKIRADEQDEQVVVPGPEKPPLFNVKNGSVDSSTHQPVYCLSYRQQHADKDKQNYI